MGRQSARIYHRGYEHSDIYFPYTIFERPNIPINHSKIYKGKNLVWERLPPKFLIGGNCFFTSETMNYLSEFFGSFGGRNAYKDGKLYRERIEKVEVLNFDGNMAYFSLVNGSIFYSKNSYEWKNLTKDMEDDGEYISFFKIRDDIILLVSKENISICRKTGVDILYKNEEIGYYPKLSPVFGIDITVGKNIALLKGNPDNIFLDLGDYSFKKYRVRTTGATIGEGIGFYGESGLFYSKKDSAFYGVEECYYKNTIPYRYTYDVARSEDGVTWEFLNIKEKDELYNLLYMGGNLKLANFNNDPYTYIVSNKSGTGYSSPIRGLVRTKDFEEIEECQWWNEIEGQICFIDEYAYFGHSGNGKREILRCKPSDFFKEDGVQNMEEIKVSGGKNSRKNPELKYSIWSIACTNSSKEVQIL